MPTDRDLLAYLVDAVDPGAREEIEAALRGDAGLRFRLGELSRQVQAMTERPVDTWRIPPPGLPSGRERYRLTLDHLPVMGGERLRAGDSFELVLDPVPDARRYHVVILFRTQQGWQVVFPTEPDEMTRLDAIEPEADGTRRLVLEARPEPGRQWWAVALVPDHVPVEWDRDEPWEAIREAITDGTVPVTSVEIDVG